MTKVLSCRFHTYLRPFNMLTVEECSETALFRHLSNHVFRILYVWKYISYEGHPFLQKCLKIDTDFSNSGKNSEKNICGLDNCI